MIGGVAPSSYLQRLESGNAETPPIGSKKLNAYLESHLINPELLRADRFEDFILDRQKRILVLIEQATCKSTYAGGSADDAFDAEVDSDTVEAEYTISNA